jgi:glycosyltransferase involved in cell wall biosynthesis
MKHKSSWILYISTFPPRECGIATFTKDLVTAMDKKFSPSIKSKVLAMNNDSTNIYNYPEDVILEISDTDISEYIETAKKINKIDAIKLVNIQHEFGIFGGEYGSYLIAFLEALKKPVLITFHSVLPNPNDKLKKVVCTLAEKSDCIIVMTKKGIDILRTDYGIKTDIKIIPHGIPTVTFESNLKEKIKLGYKDKIILSSFGMMNSGKGYEYVIEALPKVVEKFPNLLYIIVGETHPVVRKKEGEQYRNLL